MGEIPFERSFSSHEKSQYWSSKNNVLPKDVYKYSHNKYFFDCPCGHEFEGVIANISKNVWCPYCSNPPKLLCNNDDCEKCFEKSFASHKKSEYWSNKNNIKPRDIYKSSDNSYLFNCNCGHEFEGVLSKISSDRWCPYCCKSSKILCNNKECKKCLERSFASNEKAQFWSEKNELKPREIIKGTSDKYIFNCTCGHEFEISLTKILIGRWCQYCCNPPNKLCTNDDCKSCFEKSFASEEKVQHWSEQNKLKPREVFKCSGTKYLFNCNKNHTFEIALCKITDGRWCSICKNKTEEKLFQVLIIDYPNIKHQFKANWCKNPITNKYLPFDFVLETEKIIIELDGAQHFKQVSNWRSPEEQYERDSYKMECANNNGYSVIRITQEDVYDDTFDWYKSLKDSIESIIQSKDIENHFISYHDDYSNFY